MPVGENKEWTIAGTVKFPEVKLKTLGDEILKAEREKVWEMTEHILRIPYTERLKYFGTSQVFDIVSMPVDQALDMYESWKKNNSVEELIKSLKPQDVIAIRYKDHGVVNIGMVTRSVCSEYSSGYSSKLDIVGSCGHTCTIYIERDRVKSVEKIGRVVETTDILGEIKKIEDEWRKNN